MVSMLHYAATHIYIHLHTLIICGFWDHSVGNHGGPYSIPPFADVCHGTPRPQHEANEARDVVRSEPVLPKSPSPLCGLHFFLEEGPQEVWFFQENNWLLLYPSFCGTLFHLFLV